MPPIVSSAVLSARCYALLVIGVLCTGSVSPTAGATPADALRTIVTDTMRSEHLKSVIVKVTVDGSDLMTDAFGESMTGVPATIDMHFRNGAVAISYVSTLLLLLAEDGTVGLDDLLSTYLPDIPHADRVTLRQLATMTSGYVDYVIDSTEFDEALYRDPFRQWRPEELLPYATSQPLQYQPGTNWNYAHTNYVLLGLALEKATGQPMPKLLSDRVLGPLGLSETRNSFTPEVPQPALHAFTAERGRYEESTYWNPSWTITNGAIQTSTITDLATTAVGIGTGKLLSEASFAEMLRTPPRGSTRPLPGCTTCAELGDIYDYGMGLVVSGDWLLQNPMFYGYAALEAYLPSRGIAIAVAATFEPGAFDDTGAYTNAADTLFRRIGAELAPENAPPVR